MATLLATWKFSLTDQRRFAELSGDCNPVHLDPVASRREIYGEVVVHGMHAVLRALEALAEHLRPQGLTAFMLQQCSARFTNPVLLNKPIRGEWIREGDESAVIRLTHARSLLAEIALRFTRGGARPAAPAARTRIAPAPTQPRTLAPDQLGAQRGAFEPSGEPAAWRAAFPHLCSMWPVALPMELGALSRLVGMECPGLNSIFSSFEVSLRPSGRQAPTFTYAAEDSDPRFGRVRMRVEGEWLAGWVEAFFRPPPTPQPGFAQIQAVVGRGEFQDQRALIVGGSRGLGEVTAKIIAAGGGYPWITYHSGAEDARRICGEIRAGGGRCESLPCDARHPGPALAQLRRKKWRPGAIYYFATPKIAANRSAPFNQPLFEQFLAYYVGGLSSLHGAYRRHWPDPVSLFFPSTVFLDEPEPGFAEYAAAKASGEMLCRYLARADRRLTVVVRRLPRLATDQTNSLLGAAPARAGDAMLDLVRTMQQHMQRGLEPATKQERS